MDLKRIIITGGPSTGKTSIINLLEEMGFAVMHEKSRDIIKESLENNSDVLPWDNLESFSEKVISQRVNQYFDSLNQNVEFTFFDRGIPDVLAYLDYDKVSIPDQFEEISKKIKYHDKVFLTPAWEEIYVTDNERREEFEKAEALMNSIKKRYVDLGYDVIEIPKDSVENRVRFILGIVEG